jgi:hypothetical protein
MPDEFDQINSLYGAMPIMKPILLVLATMSALALSRLTGDAFSIDERLRQATSLTNL